MRTQILSVTVGKDEIPSFIYKKCERTILRTSLSLSCTEDKNKREGHDTERIIEVRQFRVGARKFFGTRKKYSIQQFANVLRNHALNYECTKWNPRGKHKGCILKVSRGSRKYSEPRSGWKTGNA